MSKRLKRRDEIESENKRLKAELKQAKQIISDMQGSISKTISDIQDIRDADKGKINGN